MMLNVSCEIKCLQVMNNYSLAITISQIENSHSVSKIVDFAIL